jgi:hypothetical protein
VAALGLSQWWCNDDFFESLGCEFDLLVVIKTTFLLPGFCAAESSFGILCFLLLVLRLCLVFFQISLFWGLWISLFVKFLYNMKILSWNCRGLAQSSTIRSLRDLIRKNNPYIIFLSETKTASPTTSSFLIQLGNNMNVQAPPSGSRGGLFLAWKNDINLSDFYVSHDMICAWCSSDSHTIKWLISFVYGPPYQKSNSDFWTTLAAFVDNCDFPWFCIGDFNAITAQHDKLGGRPFQMFSRNTFSFFMNQFGMIDLGFSGNPYTWSNHRQGLCLIKELLDRGIATNQWIQHFPSFSVTHLPAHNSDHNPLLLDTSSRSPSLPCPFRFEEFWTRDPTCGVVINEAWSILVSGSPAFCLMKKIKEHKASYQTLEQALLWGN